MPALRADQCDAVSGGREGLYQCNKCREQFTVTVGTVFERSKIPLNKWLLCQSPALRSKKGMSAHQIHRMLGVTYKTAWFMCHRIREAMKHDDPPARRPRQGCRSRRSVRRRQRQPRFRQAPPRRRSLRWSSAAAAPVRSTLPTSTRNNVRAALVTNIDRAIHADDGRSPFYATSAASSPPTALAHTRREYRHGRHPPNTAENFFPSSSAA